MKVSAVHRNLKREILESGYLSAAQWANVIELKVRQYLETEEVRKMFSHREGIPITREHICAIILYCDCTDLCTAFSATFRREDVFETIESVKKRHSHFANFGRLLVETVWQFGLWESQQGGKGPFFCGLSCMLNIGSYAITVKGPCSTSTVRTVALNFATKQGVIIKLDNDSDAAKDTLLFDCSWISNYPEESERLWLAGNINVDDLRIVSLVVMQSAKNYEQMIRALFLFDSMISGAYLGRCKIRPEEEDFQLLRELITTELRGGIGGVSEFDEYLKKEWKLFLQSKEKMQLSHGCIKSQFDIFSELVMSNGVPLKEHEFPQGNLNIFKAEWISIFPRVRRVYIETFGAGYGSHGQVTHYKFRLEALLDFIMALPRTVDTVIVFDDGQWAQRALTDDIKYLFAVYGWTVEYGKVKSRAYNRWCYGDYAYDFALSFHSKLCLFGRMRPSWNPKDVGDFWLSQ